jgi:hypothetical protein
VGTIHALVVAVGLGLGRRRSDRGAEDAAARRDFDGALHPAVAPGRPRARLANAEGPFGHKLAPSRAILREGGRFGEGGYEAARSRLVEVLEVAPE